MYMDMYNMYMDMYMYMSMYMFMYMHMNARACDYTAAAPSSALMT